MNPTTTLTLSNKKLKCLLTLAIFLISSVLSLRAQVSVSKVWDKTYGGGQLDYLTSVIATSDGGYLLAGTTEPGVSSDKTESSRGGQDYWVVKLNADGTKAWDRTYGGSSDDWLAAAISTPDGGFLLGGYSFSGISGERTDQSRGDADYWVVKLNTDGDQVWDKAFGGVAYDELTTLTTASDGGYLLGGYSFSGVSGDKSEASNGEEDYWVVKLNADGTKVWDRTYGGSGKDLLNTVKHVSGGGFLLGGTSQSGAGGSKTEASKGGQDYWVVKLNADGTKAWDRTYGGSGKDDLKSLLVSSDGSGYLLGGLSVSGISNDKTEASRGGEDYWVVKLNADGTKVWDRTYGGSGNDWIGSLMSTKDGGYLLGGGSGSGVSGDKSEASKGGKDFWVVKLNADGTKVWDKTFGGSGDDWIESMASASDDDFLLGGASDSGIGNDKTEASRGLKDYWIVKANVSILNAASLDEEEQNFIVYPNPSSGNFNFIFDDVKAGLDALQLTLTNSTGQIVKQQKVYVNQLESGFQLTTADLPSGFYVLRVNFAGKEINRKLMLQK
ncbi:T9SS type A sorting domain-containing protein [Pontibacter locisalis]|uniref:T9SS type A sorting domain-containing protein n=1 Tax=Pontibacter locisalis TaxID=1719035 RepID=A0ABW5IIB1_9BACT